MLSEFMKSIWTKANRFADKPPAPTTKVLCWMVYLWRAIALNGVTMMHAFELRRTQPDMFPWAWHLLCLRVWAVAEDCQRLITDPKLCASVYSGQTTMLPGWAQRGMPVPFIYDIMYMVGVPANPDDSKKTAILDAYLVYTTCLEALLHRKTEKWFLTSDFFLARLVGDMDVTVWKNAQEQHIDLLRTKAVQSLVPDQLENNDSNFACMYRNLIQSLSCMCQVDTKAMFKQIYQAADDTIPLTLQWELFCVKI